MAHQGIAATSEVTDWASAYVSQKYISISFTLQPKMYAPHHLSHETLCATQHGHRLSCRIDADSRHFHFVRSCNDSSGRLPPNSNEDYVPKQRTPGICPREKYHWPVEEGRIWDNVV